MNEIEDDPMQGQRLMFPFSNCEFPSYIMWYASNTFQNKSYYIIFKCKRLVADVGTYVPENQSYQGQFVYYNKHNIQRITIFWTRTTILISQMCNNNV